jgi:hypothetical protein
MGGLSGLVGGGGGIIYMVMYQKKQQLESIVEHKEGRKEARKRVSMDPN